jgi:hypothetical protein
VEAQEIRRIAQAMLEKGSPVIGEVPLVPYLSSLDMTAVVVAWGELEVRKIVKYQVGFLDADELKRQIEMRKLEAMMDLLAAIAAGERKP